MAVRKPGVVVNSLVAVKSVVAVSPSMTLNLLVVVFESFGG